MPLPIDYTLGKSVNRKQWISVPLADWRETRSLSSDSLQSSLLTNCEALMQLKPRGATNPKKKRTISYGKTTKSILKFQSTFKIVTSIFTLLLTFSIYHTPTVALENSKSLLC